MDLKFTALEIGSGDAFLLEDSENNWNCLFDAGGSKSTIVTLLKKKFKKRKNNKLNLAICSHNDIDHTNGFIGLLQSDIEIDEIWLPGTWASVLKYVEDNGVGPDEIECMVNVEKEYFGQDSECPRIRENDKSTIANLLDSETAVSIEDFDESLAAISEVIELESHDFSMKWFLYNHYYWHRREKNMGAGHPSLLLALNKITLIGGLAYRKGCKIRWFNPFGPCNKKMIDYGFVALTSSKMMQVQKPKNAYSFAFLCCLTVENVYSIVFEYCDNDTPIIRFSADSDCYAQSVSPYPENIIVTAPHHGSEANDRVYRMLQGNKIIWVRSDRKSSKRPCQAFKNLDNKYCLACYQKNSKCEICFTYDHSSKRWEYQNGIACHC